MSTESTNNIHPTLIDFDNKAIPSYIEAPSGAITITNRHYITTNSLEWRYKSNDCLTFNVPITYNGDDVLESFEIHGQSHDVANDPLGFRAYVYCEEACKTILTFEFGSNNEVDCSFQLHMNFTGWREISLPYDRGIMKGRPGKLMTHLNILTKDVSPGKIYFGRIDFMARIVAKMVASDSHLPTINKQPFRKSSGDININDNHRNTPFFPAPTTVSKIELADLQTIEDNLLALSPEMDKSPNLFAWEDENRQDLIDGYNDFDIKFTDSVITGKSIQTAVRHGRVTEYNNLIGKVANYYQKTKDPLFEEMFLNLVRNAIDQDYVLRWYSHRGFGSGVLRLKSLLKDNNLLDPVIQHMKRKFDYNRIYDLTSLLGRKNIKGENTDDTFFCLPNMLIIVLLMEDGPLKVQNMKMLIKFIEEISLGYGPGMMSSYKADGTAIHHGTFIMQYQYASNITLSRLFRILYGTIYDLNEESHRRYKHVLKTEAFVRNGNFAPFTISHYAFNHSRKTELTHFANYAFAGIDNNDFDRDIAADFMNLAKDRPRYIDSYFYKKFEALGIEASPYPSGHKTLSYSAAAFHRRDDWCIGVKAHSRYVFPMEIWRNMRYVAFSMFRSYGFTEIFYPTKADESGVNNGLQVDKGFDWCRWPGATALKVPLDFIKAQPLKHQDEYGEMLFSDQTFVGGLDTECGNGLFISKLRGHDKYDMDTFYASKSYFYFDDYILCMGSDIESGLKDYAVETTLFQNHLQTEDEKIHINALEGVCEFGFEKVIDVTEPIWLMDNRANGYYLFDKQVLHVGKFQVNSRDSEDLEDTQGNRATAWLQHGHAPSGASYAYMINVNTTPTKMSQLSEAMLSEEKPFEILKQDKEAHIVTSLLHQTTSYVLFEKFYELGLNKGYLLGATQPCLVSIKDNSSNLSIAVSDPDLRFYEGTCEDTNIDYSRSERSIYGRYWLANESRPSTVRLKIKGQWTLASTGETVQVLHECESCTIIEVICKDGLSTHLTLSQ